MSHARGAGTLTRSSTLERAKALAVLVLAASAAPAAMATGTKTTHPPLRHMSVDIGDKGRLRNGALEFMHRCLPCHSMQGARFVELAGPLGLTKRQVERFLNPTRRRVRQTVVSAMPVAVARKVFHKAPPDLTVIAKRRGVDWLYTYLTSFYLDPSRPTGVNNVVFYNVAMPDVFVDLQGLQAPVKRNGLRFGSRAKIAVGVKPVTQGAMSRGEFDRTVKDIVAFLYFVAHPHQTQRYAMGPWVLGLLGGFSMLSYSLYRLYWRRVIRPAHPRWWTYWRRR